MEKKKMLRKVLTIIMVLAMMLTQIPLAVMAMADEGEPVSPLSADCIDCPICSECDTDAGCGCACDVDYEDAECTCEVWNHDCPCEDRIPCPDDCWDMLPDRIDPRLSFIIGSGDGAAMRPGDPMDVAGFATMFFRLMSVEARSFYFLQSLDDGRVFDHVSSGDWRYVAISTLAAAGAFGDNPEEIDPEELMSIDRFIAFAANFMDVDEAEMDAFYPLIWEGSRPAGDITRAEAVAIMLRMRGFSSIDEYIPAELQYYFGTMYSYRSPDVEMDENSWYYLYFRAATISHCVELVGGQIRWHQFLYEGGDVYLWTDAQDMTTAACLDALNIRIEAILRCHINDNQQCGTCEGDGFIYGECDCGEDCLTECGYAVRDCPCNQEACVCVCDCPIIMFKLAYIGDGEAVIVDDTIVYTLGIRNYRVETMYDFLVVDTLPIYVSTPTNVRINGELVEYPVFVWDEDERELRVFLVYLPPADYDDGIVASVTKITFEVEVLERPESGVIINNAQLYGPPNDEDSRGPVGDGNYVRVDVDEPEDPTLEKGTDIDYGYTVIIGDTIVYSLVVRNENLAALYDFLVVDTLPVYVSAPTNVRINDVEVEYPVFVWDEDERELRVFLVYLAPASATEITFEVEVLGRPESGVITNSAQLYGPPSDPDDEDSPRDPIGGPGEEDVIVEPQLIKEKESNVGTVVVGGQVAYTLRVTNTGSYTHYDYLIVDDLNLNLLAIELVGEPVVYVNVGEDDEARCQVADVRVVDGQIRVYLDILPGVTEVRFTIRVIRAVPQGLTNVSVLYGPEQENPDDPDGPPVRDQIDDGENEVIVTPPGQGPGPGPGPGTPPGGEVTPPDDDIDLEDDIIPLVPFTTTHYRYLIGDTYGRIRPRDQITRAEVATIFFRLITDDFREEMWTQSNPFPDVVLTNWFNNGVSTMTNAEVLRGMPDGTFQPNRSITRAEFAAIISRFVGNTYDGDNLFPDIEGHWAQDYINLVTSLGWVWGMPNGDFEPNRPITRAEAATIVNRILIRHPETLDDLLEGRTEWPDMTDSSLWYYIDVQEATNSHSFEIKDDDVHETWIEFIVCPEWVALERPESTPRSHRYNIGG